MSKNSNALAVVPPVSCVREELAELSLVFGSLAAKCTDLACDDDATDEELVEALDELKESPFGAAEMICEEL